MVRQLPQTVDKLQAVRGKREDPELLKLMADDVPEASTHFLSKIRTNQEAVRETVGQFTRTECWAWQRRRKRSSGSWGYAEAVSFPSIEEATLHSANNN